MYHCPDVIIYLRVLGLPLVNYSDPVFNITML